MRDIATELQKLITDYSQQLYSLSEDDLLYKSSPIKWSKKELIGHLIDSAQNNTRRFIVAQYEENPAIGYNQDIWVTINNYQQWNAKELIHLWHNLNRQMVLILKNINEEMSQRICHTDTSHTIEWLASDYLKHLKHHVHQVLSLEPVAYP